jgi:hypothetical protein
VGAVACLGKDVGDDKVHVERDVEEVALSGLAKQAVWRIRTKPFARRGPVDLLRRPDASARVKYQHQRSKFAYTFA